MSEHRGTAGPWRPGMPGTGADAAGPADRSPPSNPATAEPSRSLHTSTAGDGPPLPDARGLAGLRVEPRDGGGYVVTYPRSLLAGLIRGPLPGWAIALGLGVVAILLLQRRATSGGGGSGGVAEIWLQLVLILLFPALIFAIASTVVWFRKRLNPITLEVWDGGARLTQPCVFEDWVLELSPGDLIQTRSRTMPPWRDRQSGNYGRVPLTRFGPTLEMTMGGGVRHCVLESQSTEVIDWTKRLLNSLIRDWEARTVAAVDTRPERAGIQIEPAPASAALPEGRHGAMRVTARSDGRLVRYTRIGMLPSFAAVLGGGGLVLLGVGFAIVQNEDDRYALLGVAGDLALASVLVVLGTLGVLGWVAWRREHPPELLIGHNAVELRVPAVFWMRRLRIERGELSSVAVGTMRDERQPVLELAWRRGRIRHVLRGQEHAALLWTQSQIAAATGAQRTALKTRKRSTVDFHIQPKVAALIVVCMVIALIAYFIYIGLPE